MSITNLNNYTDILATSAIFEGINTTEFLVRQPYGGVNLLTCDTKNLTVNIDGTLTTSAFGISSILNSIISTNSSGTFQATNIGSNLNYNTITNSLNTIASPIFTNITGTLLTASQPNITSLGTLSGLTINGSLSLPLLTDNALLYTNGSDIIASTSISNPLLFSAGNLSLQYNTTNLKLTSNALNTIQDITSLSSPTFSALTITNGLSLGTNLTVGGSAIITGNLTVNGTTTTVNSTTVSITDNFLQLANANSTTNSLDIGFYGEYYASSSVRYTGLFYKSSNLGYQLFENLTVQPTSTVSTSDASYTLANLSIAGLNASTGIFSSTITTNITNSILSTDGSGNIGSLTISSGLTFLTNSLSANINTTNMQFTSGAINTSQDINNHASPTFTGLTLTGLSANTIVSCNSSKVLQSLSIGTNLNLSSNTLSVVSSPSFSNIIDTGLTAGDLVYANTSQQLASALVSANLSFSGSTLDTVQPIQHSSSPTFTGLTLTGLSANTIVSCNGSQLLESLLIGNNLSLSSNTLSVFTTPSFANIIDTGLTAGDLVYANTSQQLASALVSANLSFSGSTLDTVQPIQHSSSPTFTGLTLTGLSANTIVSCNGSQLLESLLIGTNLNLTSNTLSVVSSPSFSSLTLSGLTSCLLYADSSHVISAASVSANLSFSGGTLDTIQPIQTSSTPTFLQGTFTDGDTTYGTSQLPSLILGTDGSKPGMLKLWGKTASSPCLIHATTANLHLDSTDAIYLNWYSGSDGVIFGKGDGSTIVASIDATGAASFNSVTDTSLTSCLLYANSSHLISAASVSANLSFSSGSLDTVQPIQHGSSPTFAGLTLTSLTANSIVSCNSLQLLESLLIGTNLNLLSNTLSVVSSPSFSNIIDSGLTANTLVYANGSQQLASASVLSNLSFSSGSLNTIQDIQTTSSPTFAGLTLNGLLNTCQYNYNLLQSDSKTNEYYKIANLPASSGGTYDHLHIVITLNNNFYAYENSCIDIILGARNGFSYTYTLKGSAVTTNATLQVYQNASLSYDIYVYLDGASYSNATYTVLENIDATVYAPVTSITTTPSGTLVFDASSSSYLPAITSLNSGNVGIATTAPSYKLDVSGTARVSNLIDTALTGGNLVYANSSSQLTSASVSANLSFSSGSLDTVQGIQHSSSPTFSALTLSGLTASTIVSCNSSKVLQSLSIGTNLSLTSNTLSVISSPSFANIIDTGLTSGDLVYANTSQQLTSASISANLSFSGGSLDTVQPIQTTSSPTFSALTLTNPLTGANGGTGVSNSGLTINLSSGGVGKVLSSDSSGSATWQALSSLGVTSLTGTQYQVLVNNTYGTATAGAITLTTPQNIATNSDVTFHTVTANRTDSPTASTSYLYISGTITPAPINFSGFYGLNASPKFATTSDTHGAYYAAAATVPSISLASGATPGLVAGLYANIDLTGNAANITSIYNIYSETASNAGTGTLTNAYGGYFNAPNMTSSVKRQALYTVNLSVGYTATDLGGTNNLIVSGNVGIGTAFPTFILDIDNGASTNYARIYIPSSGTGNYYTGWGVKSDDDAEVDLLVRGSGFVGGRYGISSLADWADLSAYGTNLNGFVIGTINNNQPLVFGTYSYERMRITATGYVGIGTTTPGAYLEVDSTDLTNTCYIYNSGGGYGTQPALRVKSAALANNHNVIQADNKNGTFFTARSDGYVFTYANLLDDYKGNAYFTGQVGIATASYLGQLNSHGALCITNTSNLPTTGISNYLAIVGGIGTPDSGRIYFGDGTGWKMHISMQNNTPTTTDLFTFLDLGYFGIGTTSPTNAFQIGTGLSFVPNWPAIGFNYDINNAKYFITNSASMIQQDNTNGGLGFYTAVSGTGGSAASLSERVFISGNGAVCINTTSQLQSSNLSINGSLCSAGNILPNATSSYDLGSSSLYWNNLYVNNIFSGGSYNTHITNVSSNYTILFSDEEICCNSSKTLVLTTPTSPNIGQTIVIQDTDNNASINNIVISPAAGQSINGNTATTGNISVGNLPNSISYSNGFLAVGNNNGSSVSIIQVFSGYGSGSLTNSVSTISLAANPTDVCFCGHYLYVTTQNNILQYLTDFTVNPVTFTYQATLTPDSGTTYYYLAQNSPNNLYLWISDTQQGKLLVYSNANSINISLTATISIACEAVCFSPNGLYGMITNQGYDYISIYNANTGSPTSYGTVTTTFNLSNICATNNCIIVSSAVSGQIAQILNYTGTPTITYFSVGYNYNEVIFNNTGDFAFVAAFSLSLGLGAIYVYQNANNSNMSQLYTINCSSPVALCYIPTSYNTPGDYLYACNFGAINVSYFSNPTYFNAINSNNGKSELVCTAANTWYLQKNYPGPNYVYLGTFYGKYINALTAGYASNILTINVVMPNYGSQWQIQANYSVPFSNGAGANSVVTYCSISDSMNFAVGSQTATNSYGYNISGSGYSSSFYQAGQSVTVRLIVYPISLNIIILDQQFNVYNYLQLSCVLIS